MVPRAETMLALAARAQHVAEVIRPALDAGRDVVCDRFAGSTLAYQGFGRGLDVTVLAGMSAWAADGVVPDRVILLTVDPGRIRLRLDRRGTTDRIEAEGAEWRARVSAGFDTLAADDPTWRVVDADGSVDEVTARILAAVGAGEAGDTSAAAG